MIPIESLTDAGAAARAGARALLAAPPVDALRLLPLLTQAQSLTPDGDIPALLDLADLLLAVDQGFAVIQLLTMTAREATGRTRALLDLHIARAYRAIGQHGTAKRFYQSTEALAPDLTHGPSNIDAAPDESLRVLYNVFAENFDKHLTGTLRYSVPDLIQALLAERDMDRNLHILDAGCGTGLCQPVLAPYAARLDGCDLSLNMLGKALQRGGYDHLWWADLLRFLPLNANRWDMIVAADVLLYIRDIETAFRHIAAALRSDGHFVFSLLSTGSADCEQQEDGHYRHGDRYIQAVAAACGLRTLIWREVIPRYERGQPVEGRLVMLQKP